MKVLTKKDDNYKLGGVIETDETFFEEIQKGARNVKGREARKRGFSCYVGNKRSKVCILTAIDRNKTSFTKPVGFVETWKKTMLYSYKDILKKTVF